MMGAAAEKYKVATQMGNQGYSHDATRVTVGEPFDSRVFLAETHAARKQHDGRGEIHSAEFIAKGAVDGVDDRGSGGHGGIIPADALWH